MPKLNKVLAATDPIVNEEPEMAVDYYCYDCMDNESMGEYLTITNETDEDVFLTCNECQKSGKAGDTNFGIAYSA